MDVNIVRFKFFKKDELKYLSHLDVLALMERALMRTGLLLLYSGGFHPKPKLSFSNPIPLGVQSLAEYCDIELLEEISAEDFTVLLNRKLPDNLKVIEAISFKKTCENKIPSLMSAIDIVLYEYELLSRKLLSAEPPNNKFPEKLTSREEKSIGQYISFDNFKKSFLMDFEKFFSPEQGNVECEADLLKIRTSIHGYEAVANSPTASDANNPQENIFFLKIYGYAKILKNSSNSIFKFNVFNECFEKFLETDNIEIRQVQKTGTYVFKDNVLKTPIKIISF
jgi:radical SAM-linked protein